MVKLRNEEKNTRHDDNLIRFLHFFFSGFMGILSFICSSLEIFPMRYNFEIQVILLCSKNITFKINKMIIIYLFIDYKSLTNRLTDLITK